MTKSSWGSRYSIVASTLALAFALGGTAYAVNTVRSSDIVDATIKTQDLGTGSVQSIDIKNGTVAPADLTAATLARTASAMARVNGIDGSVAISRGGIGTVVRNAAGRYTIQAGRDVTSCLYVVTPRASDIAAGADQASTTAVNVYLEDPSSGQIDADFDIVFFC